MTNSTLPEHAAGLMVEWIEAERQGLTEEQLADELNDVKRQIFEETYGP